jgi:hypothetical protein
MKCFSILMLLFMGFIAVSAQSPCANTTSRFVFNPNKTKAVIDGSGRFLDAPTYLPSYKPDTSYGGAGTMFYSSVSFQDDDYISGTGADIYPGPIDNNGLPVCAGYDKIWSVRKTSISSLIADLNDNGVINNPISVDLLAFPCRNNPHFSLYNNGMTLLPNHNFAAFNDVNSDGIYDPLDGDYPIVPRTDGTVIADLLAYMVQNDITRSTSVPKQKLEKHLTFYGFSSSDSLIDRTTFVHYKIINWSSVPKNIYAELIFDADLGCGIDDYLGTVVNKNTIYTYNLDAYDDVNCPGGGVGMGANVGVQAITFLNKPILSSVYNTSNNHPQTGAPTSLQQLLNAANGNWRDGTPLYPCDNGVSPCATGGSTKFAFPDNPNNAAGWSMLTANMPNLNYTGMMTAKYNNMGIGQVFELAVAYSYHQSNGLNHLQNVNKLYDNLPILQNF